MEIFRTEHPKPQFMRDNWVNLNGEWQFEIDYSNSGVQKKFYAPEKNFTQKINVPFCPESKLSGIAYLDFMNAVWYKREFTLTADQLRGRVILHFGAVDYEATVYVNGSKCGVHKGGYISFSFDITDFVSAGVNTVTVYAADDQRSKMVPNGKQCDQYYSYGCSYTRTTGIWQTVWLEFMPETHIVSTKYYPDPDNTAVTITAELAGSATLCAQVFYEGHPVGTGQIRSSGGNAAMTIALSEKHLWEVGHGRLYDLVLTYGDDRVSSYFGLRSVRLDGFKFLINNRSVFQRLVLDQGFYPDGIYTAPSDSELIADIDRSMAMGFNGARLHEKIFEERFLYHCDRKGYIVWGEYPNWGLDHTYPEAIYSLLPEWTEEVNRDFNHPAIIGWCPFNESWDINYRKIFTGMLTLVYRTTKALDPTRPCIDTSGNFHEKTDIFDVHDYEQDPVKFAGYYNSLPVDGTFVDHHGTRQTYRKGQPVFISEYGGIGWSTHQNGWSYGNAPQTEAEFKDRFQRLTAAIMDNPCIQGLCYTQLTDVEQEQNGLYTYDRKPKFPPEEIAPFLTRKAAIED